MNATSGGQDRPLRSDAERSVRSILEAAEQVLSENPAAPMERIAELAGVARTTIHRRFTSRQALLDHMAVAATEHLSRAIETAHPDTAPPLVALHQVTANVLRTKINWSFALEQTHAPASPARAAQERINERCRELFGRARDQGVLAADADVEWTRRVYYALISESLNAPGHDDADAVGKGEGSAPGPDTLAERIVRTLLHGLGPGPGPQGT